MVAPATGLTGDQDIKRATEPEHPHRGPMRRINEDHRISRPSKYIADPSALGSIWIIGLHLDPDSGKQNGEQAPPHL